MLPAAFAKSFASRLIRPRLGQGPPTMTRSPGAAGFSGQSIPVASPRLIDAVVASLALGAFSLCLVVTLTVLSIRSCMAMPF
jgi:hypothetical protein